MKSLVIWISCVAAGALAGFGLSLVLEMHPYLLIAFGVIIGSSAGITWNIHREREEDFEALEFEEEEEFQQSNSSEEPN